ncbi:MAG: hypothetical protein IJ087_06565 [Eggerthellaceae bacterium]|nr:hypothetical protein [Eggerthellaceae bacterium]
MAKVIAENGVAVTEEMIASWCEALDADEWPKGWHNVGKAIDGKPPSQSATETISIKVPLAMKSAVDREARNNGISTSAYLRNLIAGSLMA